MKTVYPQFIIMSYNLFSMFSRPIHVKRKCFKVKTIFTLKSLEYGTFHYPM